MGIWRWYSCWFAEHRVIASRRWSSWRPLLLGSGRQTVLAGAIEHDDLDKRGLRAAIAPHNSSLAVVLHQHCPVMVRPVAQPIGDHHMAIALEVEAGEGTFRQLVTLNLADHSALRVKLFQEPCAGAGG